jgi:hypothetical protein
MTKLHIGPIFLPPPAADTPPWWHPLPSDLPRRLPGLPTAADQAQVLGALVDERDMWRTAHRVMGVNAASVVDVFGRCEWCRRPTPGVLTDCVEPTCPGGAR